MCGKYDRAIFYILCGGCTAAHDAPRVPSLENGLSLFPFVAQCWGMAADEPDAAGKGAPRCVGRESTPSAAVVDSQEVLTTEVAQEVGYDGAKLSHCGTSGIF